MKSLVTFDDWIKLEFRVAEIKGKGLIVGEKTFKKPQSLNLNEGKKIIVGIYEDKILILKAGNSLIVPEKDIENGCRIG